MNKNAEKLLETLELPEVHLEAHKKELRRALLSEYKPEIRKKFLWKGGDYIMKHKFVSFSAVGMTAIVAIMAVTLLGANPYLSLKPAQAEAKELVNRAFDRVLTLTPEEKEVLRKKLDADLKQSLEEARNAKDLTVVSEDEIHRIDPPTPDKSGKETIGYVFKHKDVSDEKTVSKEEFEEAAPGVRVAPHNKLPVPKNIKVLKYTNPDGNVVMLGINEKDEPVMKMIRLTSKDTQGLPRENVDFKVKLTD